MSKPLSADHRRIVLFAACGAILATFPTLVLLPLRQAHRLSDPPYFMATGLMIGLSIACLTKAISALVKSRSNYSAK